MSLQVNFVTTNAYKFDIAEQSLQENGGHGLTVVQYAIETPEIQDNSAENIAEYSAKWVASQIGGIAVASDVAFSISALNGFPGPFIKYANNWFTPEDVLRLMSGKEDRKAWFTDVLACATPNGDCKTFTQVTEGKIVDAERPEPTKWTMDALFVPDGHALTLAEMDDSERDAVWSTETWKSVAQHIRDLKS